MYSLNLSLALPLSIPFYSNLFVSLSRYSYLIYQYSLYTLYILHSLRLTFSRHSPRLLYIRNSFTIQFLSIYSNSFSLKNASLYLFLYVLTFYNSLSLYISLFQFFRLPLTISNYLFAYFLLEIFALFLYIFILSNY